MVYDGGWTGTLSSHRFEEVIVLVQDRVIALIAAAVSILVYWKTFAYPSEVVAFPRFLLAVFFGLAALLFIFPGRHKSYNFKLIFSKEKIITVLLLVGYTVVFPVVGYFVTTFIFAVFYLWMFKREGLGSYLIYSGIFVSVMYVVFQKGLYVWFPEGLLL